MNLYGLNGTAGAKGYMHTLAKSVVYVATPFGVTPDKIGSMNDLGVANVSRSLVPWYNRPGPEAGFRVKAGADTSGQEAAPTFFPWSFVGSSWTSRVEPRHP